MALIFAHGKPEDPKINLIYTCLRDVKIELKSQSRVHTAVARRMLSAACAHGSGMVSMAMQSTRTACPVRNLGPWESTTFNTYTVNGYTITGSLDRRNLGDTTLPRL